MKKIVYLILIFSMFFFLNIGFYFYSDSYVSFLKEIKYWEWDEWKLDIVNDDYLLETFVPEENTCNCEDICEEKRLIEEKRQNDIYEMEQANIKENSIIPIVEDKSMKYRELEEQNYENINQILEKFSSYNLSRVDYNQYYNIFDITNEYSDYYITYKKEDFELYIFLWWDFHDIYNTFELVLNDNLWQKDFKLKRLDNFWNRSFFINLNTWDDFVRIVIDDWNILYWLKIKKSYYPNIKNIF